MSQQDQFDNSNSELETGTADRRGAERESMNSEVKVNFETCELIGVSNNLSNSGILFFTEGDLRVSVSVEVDGEQKTLFGSLVRCERIKGDHRGWAVEFTEN